LLREHHHSTLVTLPLYLNRPIQRHDRPCVPCQKPDPSP
jgi:hypothetical protein